ncbi:hypothetical protein LC612_36730, partial [Nostoc sp. CHAB 5834]|nr:hypothetical protein [Nostoc sp. CHAB 5834]
FPEVALYADDGELFAFSNESLPKFQEDAFFNSGFYRRHAVKASPGQPRELIVAAHPQVLRPLAYELQHCFFDEQNLRPSTAEQGGLASEGALGSYSRALDALDALGRMLAGVRLGHTYDEAQDQLFHLVAEVFGKQRAWSVFEVLRHRGLFAVRKRVLMHESAYRVVVEEFAAREIRSKASEPPRSSRLTLREHVTDLFTEFYRGFTARQDFQGHKLGAALPVDWDHQLHQYASLDMTGKYAQLAPLTNLWSLPDLPLIGHYWGGVSPDEALRTVDHDSLVDFFVFQWARQHLRIDFRVPDERLPFGEVVVTGKMHRVAAGALKAAGQGRSRPLDI